MKRIILRFAVSVAALIFGFSSGFSADRRAEEATKPISTEANIFIQPDATCISWTDGCRVCRSYGKGNVACSNVSISCRLENIHCTTRQFPELLKRSTAP
jgi:hypothetical protein